MAIKTVSTPTERLAKGEGIFEDDRGQQFKFNSDINADQILVRGLTFVRGTDVRAGIRESFGRTGIGIEIPDESPTLIGSLQGKETMDKIEGIIRPPEDDTKPEAPPLPPPTAEETLIQQEVDAQKTEEQKKAERKEKELEDFFSGFEDRLEKNKQSQIANIKAQSAQIRAKAEEANIRQERLQQTIGVRFGGRFVPQSTEALFQAKVDEGIARIQEINAEENRVISAITNAFDEKSFSLALQEFNALQQIRKDRDDELDKLEEVQLEALIKLQEEGQQASVEEGIATLLQQGITNPASIFTMLNESGLNITSQQIADTLKDLLVEESGLDLTGEAKEFKSFVNLGLIDETLPIQQQWEKYIDLTVEDKVLTVAEAQKLGVPFGTTESQAFGLKPSVEDRVLSVSEAEKLGVPFGTTELEAYGTIIQSEDERPTTTQFQAATFAKRMEQAEEKLSGGRGIFVPFVPNFKKSQDRRLFEQAARNFINALLRRESGAAISPEEFVSAQAQYIPLASDGDEILEQKAKNREIVFVGLRSEGAAAFDILSEQIGGFNAFSSEFSQGELSQEDLNEVDTIIGKFNPIDFF